MYRDVLVNKWFLGAFIFCVICSIGCLIWYQMDMAKFRKEMNVYEDFSVQLVDEKNDAKVAKRTNVSGKITQNERNENGETTAEDSISGDEISNTGAVNNATLPKTQNHRTNVSPYGFGPYPDIPADFPAGKISLKSSSKNHELLWRVWIKLWKQGEQVEGVTFGKNGLVYPIIKGKVYVEWEEFVSPDGTVVKEVVSSIGHPDDSTYQSDIFSEPKGEYITPSTIAIESTPSYTSDTSYDMEPGAARRLSNKIVIPSHLEVLSFDEGIDPYELLDLPLRR